MNSSVLVTNIFVTFLKGKMKKLSINLSIFAMLLSFFFISCEEETTTTPQTKANLRVIHTSYNAPNVDVKVDGTNQITNLAFGASSKYVPVNTGNRAIVVNPANGTAEVIKANLDIKENTNYTVIAVDELSKIAPIVLTDNIAPKAGKVKVRFVHASPDAPAVDIKVGSGSSAAVFGNVAFKASKDYVEVDPGSYSFVVTAAGKTEELIKFNAVTLADGAVLTVVAMGTFNAADNYPFQVKAFVDAAGAGDAAVNFTVATPGTGKVQFVHAVPNAPAVDIFANNTVKLTTTPLTFGNATGYISVTEGTYAPVQVRLADGTNVISVPSFPVVANTAVTIFATGDATKLSELAPLVLTDDLTAPAAGKAHVRFVHASPDATAVNIGIKGNTSNIFTNFSFRNAGKPNNGSAFTPVDAGTYDFVVRDAATNADRLPVNGVKLEAGKIYTIYARDFYNTMPPKINAGIIVHN